MARTAETASVQRETRIDASPATVWEFLVDPDKARRWMGVSVSIEPSPGAAYRCEMESGRVALGEVVEADPPHRLVFTWGWQAGVDSPVPPGSSTVEIELVPDGAGTRLCLTHRDLPHEESAQRHGEGWDHYLPRLVTAAIAG